MSEYMVYILVNTDSSKTYIGITNNPTRRIRQHNGELVGGAKYTTSNIGIGMWIYYGFIKNLTKSQALSIEKKIKLKSRKVSGNPITRRLKAIEIILNELNNPEIKLEIV